MKPVQKGRAIERLACRYLQQQGLRLIMQNYRAGGGEIDLIMQDQQTLVFIEVRFRHRPYFGNALESITLIKRQRLRQAAAYYLQQHSFAGHCRFDVCAANMVNNQVKLIWLANAFSLFEE